jgi:hypothetical protein
MKTYLFIVKYEMQDLAGEFPENYWLADNYLIKLMKDRDDVVYLGAETEIGRKEMVRELFFKCEGLLETTFDAMKVFSDNDEDFTASYMDIGEKTSLTLSYEETDEPISDGERKTSKLEMAYDPREAIKAMEDDMEEAEEIMLELGIDPETGAFDDDDDEDEPN